MIWLEMTTKERKCRYIKSSFSIKFNLTSSLYHHYSYENTINFYSVKLVFHFNNKKKNLSFACL